MVARHARTCLGWMAGRALAGQLVLGLVAALLALTSDPKGASATASQHDHALRADLQAILDGYLAARRKPEGISAVSAFVSQGGGKPSFSVVTGTTGRTSRVPIDDRTLFEIGSNTKSFTSALVLKEEAAGHLDIDQTLGQWLPRYSAWRDASIRSLLNMTARIPTYSEAPALQRAQAADPFRHYTPRELIAYAYPSATVHLPPPTDPWFYSNTNYILAGLIVAKSAGVSYPTQLRRRIFGPLGLDDTFYSARGLPEAVTRRMPSGYWEDPACGLYQPDCRRTTLAPLLGMDMRTADITWGGTAGGIVSTPRDLSKWLRALFGGRVVPPAQLKEMLSAVSDATGKPLKEVTPTDPRAFALGLARQLVPGIAKPFWFYEGESLGYRAAFAFFEEDDLVITAMTNSRPSEDQDRIGALMTSLYQTVTGRH
jgi:D-alanyl-D-alanine carboxypeptidase